MYEPVGTRCPQQLAAEKWMRVKRIVTRRVADPAMSDDTEAEQNGEFPELSQCSLPRLNTRKKRIFPKYKKIANVYYEK